MIQVGLSLMIEEDFLAATEQLFLDGLVDVAEWSFDMGWGRTLPAWLERLLIDYSESGDLLGHGVSYSILDASHSSRTPQWLVNLKAEKSRLCYRHVTVHIGFMGAGHFHFSAPLPMPLTKESEAVGRQRLIELAEVVDGSVGLENLAFAFSSRDVADQGQFLDRLLESVDGFLLLDLHNIYCQTCNFGISGDTLLSSYPLSRVRELHVSGGSWSRSDMDDPDRLIRRDTHDDQVPEAVFELLELALESCPKVETVVFERLGGTIGDAGGEQLRRDYCRVRDIVVGYS